jgi:hypothetical protein
MTAPAIIPAEFESVELSLLIGPVVAFSDMVGAKLE